MKKLGTFRKQETPKSQLWVFLFQIQELHHKPKKKLSLGKYLWIKPFQITPDILLIPNIKRIQRKYL